MTKQPRRVLPNLILPASCWLAGCLLLAGAGGWHVLKGIQHILATPSERGPLPVLTLRSKPDVVAIGSGTSTIQLYLDRNGLSVQRLEASFALPDGVQLVSITSADSTCASSLATSNNSLHVACSLGEERPGASTAVLQLTVRSQQVGQGLLRLTDGSASSIATSYPLTLTPTTLVSK